MAILLFDFSFFTLLIKLPKLSNINALVTSGLSTYSKDDSGLRKSETSTNLKRENKKPHIQHTAATRRALVLSHLL